MKFKKYQHIEKFGNEEVENITIGDVYVFPKIDGTNGSLWLNDDSELSAGSRNRELTLNNDNQNFYKNYKDNDNIISFLSEYPNLRLFGEYLVEHTISYYRDNAWQKFYVFDVCEQISDTKIRYLDYEEYSELLEFYNIDYIPPLKIFKNPSYEQLIKELDKNYFLIPDGKESGEGIVIKNYSFFNKYGRQTWAKIVRNEFKEKHSKKMGAPKANGSDIIEEKIVDDIVTKSLIEKEYSKIVNECDGWRSQYIPRLLNTVFYCVITEEMWNIIKKYKRPKIDFKLLNLFVTNKIKKIKSDLF